MFSKRRAIRRVSLLMSSAVLFLLFLAVVSVHAQFSTGTILGVVKDTSGAFVPNATVTVINIDTQLTRTQKTGEDGAFRFPVLPVGRYTLKAEATGFKTETRQGLMLDVAQDEVVDLTLQVGSQQEQVLVTGEAPIVDVTNSSLAGTVQQTQLANLPLNGRNYIDLVMLQKGVTKATELGNGQGTTGEWFSSNGAPMRSNNIVLDGARLNNAFAGASGNETGTTLGVDGIQEYKIITDSFSAEYGMSMGGQVVLVSKGGTNQFHGTAFEFFRNSALDARNFFDYTSLNGGPRLPPLQRNNFGGSFGGPIKKNKTFFYAVFEGLRENLGQSLIDSVIPANCYGPSTGQILTVGNPCATASGGVVNPLVVAWANAYPHPNLGSNTPGAPPDRFALPASQSAQTTTVNYGQIRLDQNFSASDTLFGRYTIDDGIQNTPLNPGLATSFAGTNQFVTLSENHIFSAAVLNTARASYSRTPINALDIFPPQLTGPQYSGVPGMPIPTISIGNGQITDYGGITSLPSIAIQNVYTFSDDVNWNKGRHAMKFGVLVNHFNDYFNALSNERGGISFPDLAGFLAGLPSHYEAVTPGSLLTRNYTFNTVGFYGQDDFRVTQRLTLNLGLRYEFFTTPTEIHGNNYRFLNVQTDTASSQGPIMRNPSFKNFSPRVGFAWDVFGDGKTAVRGGAGILYDVGNIGSALKNQMSALPPLTTSSSSQSGVLTLPFTFTPAEAGRNITTINYNIGQPHMVEYNLTVERQFPGGMALSLSYVGSRGYNLWTTREFNWFQPLSITNGLEYWGPGVSNYGGGLFFPNSAWAANGGNQPSLPVNPNWDSQTMYTTGALSWYNALEVELNKRITHGLQFQVTYTYSRSLDDAQSMQYSNDCGINAPGSTSNADPIFPINDKGPSCTDQPNDLSVNLLYFIPNVRAQGFVGKLLHGWWLGNIIEAQSGLPFAPNVVNLISNSGVFRADQGDRPNLVTQYNLAAAQAVNPAAIPFNPSTIYAGGSASQWFNPNMFTLVGPNQTAACPTPGSPNDPASTDPMGLGAMCSFGYLGDASRDDLRGPGLFDWDFSINKDTALPFLGEAGKLEFRAEIFNILNHTNFGLPNGTIFAGNVTNETPLPNAGQILYTNTTSRQIQFGLKVIF